MLSQEYIIIVAGGSGKRIKSNIPKQFIEVNGRSLIVYTIGKFFAYNPSIGMCIVVHKDYLQHLNDLIKRYFPGKTIHTTIGGDTRFNSVKKGLELVEPDNTVVGIHDAARPMVSVETIKRCFETAAQKGNAIPVTNVTESLRIIENNTNKSVNRNNYKVVQTPQCFNAASIKKAFEQEYSSLFTDDASVLEKTGEKIFLVEGNVENIKITHDTDLILAQHLLK
ncbi:MAG TPA: 2-C-methyl-D-erythritol 4-phosphate cytidylyltransferase [Bacteroidia bacterium]|jgi:2-C-methyl-D-erythritol 4-phosphate cytidylyltransferase|nr:2-C-methyl-D-erythritol 4-phosphate cytidylyltransferase [Bacteroidia bacterium]